MKIDVKSDIFIFIIVILIIGCSAFCVNVITCHFKFGDSDNLNGLIFLFERYGTLDLCAKVMLHRHKEVRRWVKE